GFFLISITIYSFPLFLIYIINSERKKRLLLSYCHIKQELKLFTTRTYKMDILSDRNMDYRKFVIIKYLNIEGTKFFENSLKKQQEKTTSERNVKNLKQLFADDATNSREKIFLVVSLIKLPPIPEDGKVPPITIKRDPTDSIEYLLAIYLRIYENIFKRMKITFIGIDLKRQTVIPTLNMNLSHWPRPFECERMILKSEHSTLVEGPTGHNITKNNSCQFINFSISITKS
ncbi:hypothetical protein Avbf_11700, partial [Armadillidium vulgare]